MERSAANHTSATWHQDDVQTREFQGPNYTLLFLLNSSVAAFQCKCKLSTTKNNFTDVKRKKHIDATIYHLQKKNHIQKEQLRGCLSVSYQRSLWHHKALGIEFYEFHQVVLLMLCCLSPGPRLGLSERPHRNKNCDQVAHTGHRHQQLTRSSLVSESLMPNVLYERLQFFPRLSAAGNQKSVGLPSTLTLLHTLWEVAWGCIGHSST